MYTKPMTCYPNVKGCLPLGMRGLWVDGELTNVQGRGRTTPSDFERTCIPNYAEVVTCYSKKF